MWRIVLVFAAALVVANTTGLLPEADDTACVDDHGERQCPPTCLTCTCAWHTLKTAPAPLIEMRAVELTSRTLELPPLGGWRGQLAPAPTTRPPIA